MTTKRWYEYDEITDADWLICTNPSPMVKFVKGKATDRKLRLFGCACCRRQWRLMVEDFTRTAVEVAERYADGLVEREALYVAHHAAHHLAAPNTQPTGPKGVNWSAVRVARHAAVCVSAGDIWTVDGTAGAIANAKNYPTTGVTGIENFFAEQKQQANLLRHIINNPSLPLPTCGPLAPSVIGLARALYSGEPCAFALHDALLDAGHAELAAHFRDPGEWHPIGCWALDVILGKS
jgi:hypothetical protein